jgi:hypothetical protein
MKRYDNGEIVTKDRMEDEEWYPNYYQPFLEFSLGGISDDVGETYENALEFFKDFYGEELSEENKARFLRWCVLLVERMRGSKWKLGA